ncbi:ExbD/TolR family protein [Deminuibacter soli]|uniref:Biopolymer transporter ExbD n=1 Tax=Deminuibacter soli TaxID=2291815 RepID=A0A3E1NNU1_9BACT|nr:biopolymer transporter ExbD [Deminuibacter soli]RFM29601.1 biopolymer transporter ExbD [Deminuibacter soli]
MARPKIPRKSTSVDMTAMCDVAFLLLSFFILTTKFKPSEAVAVTTPSSVASKVAPEKDVVLISITKDGKVFLSMDDVSKKQSLLNSLNQIRSAGWSEADINALAKLDFWGMSIAGLKQQLTLPKDQQTDKTLPGISVKDTANNEMNDWMRAAVSTYSGGSMNLLIKGDNESKYPAFKAVKQALTKNDLLKFQLVTNPQGVPTGTDLYKANQITKGGAPVE